MSSRLLSFAREMRRAPTRAEWRLWSALRMRQCSGRKWRRQVPFDRFILDFYCPSLRLAIEVDGGTHDDPARDAARDAALHALGVDVLRVLNDDVMANLEGVLRLISEREVR
jgi:very-short-patch-repair endonuclease